MENKEYSLEGLEMNCRFCNNNLEFMFLDLGKSPMANSYLKTEGLNKMESFYPLRAYVCSNCFLVQLDEFESPKNIFTEYAYMSSYSESMLKHVQNFVEKSIERFHIDKSNQVIEIASNDGYLLQFYKNEGIPCLGVEPAINVAKIAEKKGIKSITKFFSLQTAKELIADGKDADLLIAFNVLPHIPNLNDFIEGFKTILKKDGIGVIQFSAYLLPFLQNIEFDTIYHEHFSFFSVYTLEKIFASRGLTIFDIEEQSIHGGSMRLYLKHTENDSIKISSNVANQIKKEIDYGINELSTYMKFQERVVELKSRIWKFFLDVKSENKTIVGYGAPAKGNTLLNYCGIDKNLLHYTVDINPYKQGRFLPGTEIPIYNPEKIFETRPDYVIILAWNLKSEIMQQMKDISKWGGKFVTLTPQVEVF